MDGPIGGYGAAMPSFAHPIAPGLRPYVASCVGYDYRLDPAAVHHGLPSTTVTLIVAFDDPLDCGWPDGSGRARFDTLVAGLHTRPSVIRTHGLQRGIQLGLTPLGVRALLRTPAGELAHEIVDGDDGSRLPASLQRRLQDADWPSRFALLDAFLARRIGPDAIRPELTEAWRVVRSRAGDVRVEDLAAHVGWSRRHLLTQFRAEFGVSPKEVVRIARFEHAQNLLRGGRPIAEVAHRAGYSDQPHLHREWRALAAQTPMETAQEFVVQHTPA